MKQIIPIEIVEQKIFMIRGHKVMIDRDLASLYGVETRVLNQAVKRNIDRFPEDFMFPLTRPEIRDLSQLVISSKIKHSPNVFAFTEQGVAMLSSVLKSKSAVKVNIQIMRAFVKLRQVLSTNKELAHKLSRFERKIKKHDSEIQAIFQAIHQLMTPPEKPKSRIGFRGVKKSILPKSEYTHILSELRTLIKNSSNIAARTINAVLTTTNWEIGRRIVLFEQKGHKLWGSSPLDCIAFQSSYFSSLNRVIYA